ncbi:hypothetical protein FJZ26_04650 [Candidatus Parvarchaeota archaeon]|nr:hypothetical protein [Candidatus Parvarchaeota archaeon]
MAGDPVEKFKAVEGLGVTRELCFQIAPSVRIALGEEFGMPLGTDITKKLIWVLRKLGAKHVFDTPLGADIIAIEEANELKKAIENGGPFPLFTSCCIGWMIYAKNTHPELEKNICTLVSPEMALGAVIKEYFAKKLGMASEPLVVSIMPCVLKEQETHFEMANGKKYVDYVFTTREIAKVIKERGLDLVSAGESEFDTVEGRGSGEGLVFGASGGVTEAAVQNLGRLLGQPVEFKKFRGDEAIKTAQVTVGGHKLNIACVWGLQNANKIIDEMKAGKTYHFVEVMACAGGCAGGGGQPQPSNLEKIRLRALALRQQADLFAGNSIQNPKVNEIYRSFFADVGSSKAREMLHLKNGHEKMDEHASASCHSPHILLHDID